MQAVVRRQVGRRRGRAVAPQIGARRHQDGTGAAQRPGDMRVGCPRGVAYRQVEPFARQRGEAVRQFQLDADLRIHRQKRRQPRHDLLAAQRDRRRHPNQAAWLAAHVLDVAEAAFDRLERYPRRVHQPLACLGQPDTARGALHQRDARRALEFRNALAHRALADAELRCSSGIAADVAEHDQRVQMHPQRFNLLLVHRAIV
ncbi:50S ribosomal protein L18 [Cupriavidus sp. HPC(L)]|nr:50S ribosomal protein L18 [Cupriavidus sp. HPC(L)]